MATKTASVHDATRCFFMRACVRAAKRMRQIKAARNVQRGTCNFPSFTFRFKLNISAAIDHINQRRYYSFQDDCNGLRGKNGTDSANAPLPLRSYPGGHAGRPG